MKKRLTAAALALALSLTLSGCVFASPDELYARPKLSREYQNLQILIEQYMAKGYEYSAPLSGDNTQPVQLDDLDGDGVNETIVCMKDQNGGERPLKLLIFQNDNEGNYHLKATIEGEGSAIYSVSYERLTSGRFEDIIVSWQLSSAVNTLTVHALDGMDAAELLRSGYSAYQTLDLDGDGQKELVLLQAGASGAAGLATYYDCPADVLQAVNSVSLSLELSSFLSLTSGMLENDTPALFVTGDYREGMSITDVLTVQNDLLTNITLSAITGNSNGTVSALLTDASADRQPVVRDVNGDGISELPIPTLMSRYTGPNPTADENQWMVKWVQIDRSGVCSTLRYTYYNCRDDWYLILPEAWLGQVTVYRSTAAPTGQKKIIFTHVEEDGSTSDFLCITRYSGDNAMRLATAGSRQYLTTQGDYVYSVEFYETDWDCGLDTQDVLDRFGRIQSNWNS